MKIIFWRLLGLRGWFKFKLRGFSTVKSGGMFFQTTLTSYKIGLATYVWWVKNLRKVLSTYATTLISTYASICSQSLKTPTTMFKTKFYYFLLHLLKLVIKIFCYNSPSTKLLNTLPVALKTTAKKKSTLMWLNYSINSFKHQSLKLGTQVFAET
jgi:hypothetical protein